MMKMEKMRRKFLSVSGKGLRLFLKFIRNI